MVIKVFKVNIKFSILLRIKCHNKKSGRLPGFYSRRNQSLFTIQLKVNWDGKLNTGQLAVVGTRSPPGR